MFQFLIEPQKMSQRVALPANIAMLVGRADSCDVQLNDPSASRVHCRVIAHDGRVTLYDAGSRWGTFVNGQRVTESLLCVGDRIQVGETILQLTLAPAGNVLTEPDASCSPNAKVDHCRGQSATASSATFR